MKLVIFGRAEGSYPENPHAPFWPALCQELHRLGHRIVFFERAIHGRSELEGAELVRYPDWAGVRRSAARHLSDSDAAIVTSASADVAGATDAVLSSNVRVRCFYDLDPAATLGLQGQASALQTTPPGGLGRFDIVLSYTGGRALGDLKTQLGARHVVPLYGCVDPAACRAVEPAGPYRADLSYLGEWSTELQESLGALFFDPARQRPGFRFTAGGAKADPEWSAPENVAFFPDLPLRDQLRFYASSRLTLSVTKAATAESGYCPSIGMFQAAACGTPVLSDEWEGLDYFFEAEREILTVRTTGHVLEALDISPERMARIGRAGRDRVLATHTAARRALDLENILEAAISLPVEQTGAGRE